MSMGITDSNGCRPSSLEDLGWKSFFQQHYQEANIPDTIPARVISEAKSSFELYSLYGELTATISGRMRYHAVSEALYPAVGDWVAVKPLVSEGKGIIQAVLPRKSKFSRKAAGDRTEEQIVSANIDIVFIVASLDGGRNFNLRRIERYLTLARGSGATPVIVLNKADLCPDIYACISGVENITPGVSVHAVSARELIGLGALSAYLTRGTTAAFLGSSGVGKSSLINSLLGVERQETRGVREEDRAGRHTTTKRELILLPCGGMVIDTPGMREIQMWGGEDDLQGAFEDIETLAGECRFRDCGHKAESGCAVKAAIEHGELDCARLESYHKLQNELTYLAAREDNSTRLLEKHRWKKIAKLSKDLQKRP